MADKFMIKHTLTLEGWSSSVTLEPEFWRAFKAIARKREIKLAVLALEIADKRSAKQKLSSAIRTYVLQDAIERAMQAQSDAQDHELHVIELRSAIRGLMGIGETVKDGHATIAEVIAGGRTNA
jgi:predicted DNA-binding ribbon-helix-helix protein